MKNKYLKWASTTKSVYWHDSGVLSEIDEAIENGAVSITLNPFLTFSALDTDRGLWAEKASHIVASMQEDEKAEALTKLVAGYYAEKLKHFYLNGKPGEGYVCAQVNPHKCADEEYMFRQAKEYAAVAENIAVKLPATQAGLAVCEKCAALGINVVVTVSFTVPQALAAGDAIQRGHDEARKNGIKPGLGVAVIMVGRLDDYLRDVARDRNSEVTESDIILAGTACFKRALQIFKERNYDAYLMGAGYRGGAQVTDIAGAPVMLSVAPKIASMLNENTPCEDLSEQPVAQDIIDRLMTVSEFARAYEPDGMTSEEFITFGAFNRTATQFIESGWNKLRAYR